MAAQGWKMNPPQAFMSSYAPRLRHYSNSLLTPVVPPPTVIPGARMTKRGTTAINYAEDGYDDDDFDDSEGGRRFTGLRSRPQRTEQKEEQAGAGKEFGKPISAPVEVQGIWREWMGKSKRGLTERQVQIQNALPLVLIPIRIDMNIQPFRPEPPLPTPSNFREYGIDDTLPAYKQQDLTPEFRLKDAFLWNLHEALITPDMFAKQFVDELDFAQDKKQGLAMSIADQIRQQLEAYAGVAMHPLFSPNSAQTTNGAVAGDGNPVKTATAAQTPLPRSRDPSSTPAPTNGVAVPSFVNGAIKSGTQTPRDGASTPGPVQSVVTPAAAVAEKVIAKATPLPEQDIHNPDDTFRCIINLSINLANRLFTDKFEWSLLHPPGLAEHFAKQTCADLGLPGEWVSMMAHAIYEAVLKLRKEACENFGLVGVGTSSIGGEMDNDAANGAEAGWRYEPDNLAEEWAPKLEILSKEEIERREGDRERQLRRLRRETARFSSTATLGPPEPEEDRPMGRGERSKKKRRFRSLSPLGRETPDVSAGYGGGTGTLAEGWERNNWRCSHCKVWGPAAWMVRDGPAGPRSLCQNCGYIFERDKRLPPWSRDLFASERGIHQQQGIR